MANKSLEAFAPDLVRWCFSASLNSDAWAPIRELGYLIRLNQVDWAETRLALLRESAFLASDEISSVGDWALVKLLYSTGNPDDDTEREEIFEALTKGQRRGKSWRLIENYCKTDPCNPTTRSENISKTAQDYAELAVNTLFLDRSHTMDVHFFNMARTGVARFAAEQAITKHRELITNKIYRNGLAQLYGLISFHEHSALVTRKNAEILISKLRKLPEPDLNEISKGETHWRTSQYQLMLAFPQLSGAEQIEALLHESSGDKFYIDLLELASPIGASFFHTLLTTAIEEDNERHQFLIIEFARKTETPVSHPSYELLEVLLNSPSRRVRIGILALISMLDAPQLISQVVQSGWAVSDTDYEGSHEDWHGSIVLLRATKAGILTPCETVPRIALDLYSQCANYFDTNALKLVALRIEQAIHRVLNFDMNRAIPEITLRAPSEASDTPYFYSLSEKLPESSNPFDGLRQHVQNQDNDNFSERLNTSFRAFADDLTYEKANLLLKPFNLEEFKRIVSSAEGLNEKLYQLFTSLPSKQLPVVHNLIIFLAYSLSENKPEQSVELYKLISDTDSLVRYTYKSARIPLLAMAIWSGPDHPSLNTLRFSRLDKSLNDHVLSLEVLAALCCNQEQLLSNYITAKLKKGEPSAVSRALMVAGFSNYTDRNGALLKRYEGTPGFIGETETAAQYAYERNIWAKHWYDLMCKTESPEDFWCYSVLFLKVVDGRCTLWTKGQNECGKPMTLFGPTLKNQLNSRLSRWKDHREEKLFGVDAPDSIYIKGFVL